MCVMIKKLAFQYKEKEKKKTTEESPVAAVEENTEPKLAVVQDLKKLKVN